MKYKLIKRTNPLNRTKEKWYLAPVNEGKVTKTDLTKELVSMSSLSRGEVANVIENLLEIIPNHLLMGKSIRLGELGTFRLSFSSKGMDNPQEFRAEMFKGAKVIFTPSVELKNLIANIELEKENKN
jgi:predicted histone-like DNA-binding protein